ncbi:PAS domain S-box protein [Flectobacillus roseus]|uniref:histidine kinase n=1 Tax=Flectobacillus roseus TaxID=502259 RepID=A0ABT6YAX2_9BACT|nr:PAS domain S-box protein [Flectobacillus roseus]MDI9860729.1 PAS domain S-box protein [Flectobacillus roseus]
MLNCSETPSLFVSPSHEIISFNAHFETIFNWHNPQPLQKGLSITEHQLPFDHNHYFRLFEEVMSGQKVDTSLTKQSHSNTIQCYIKGEPIYCNQGTIQGALFSFKNLPLSPPSYREIDTLTHCFESILSEAHEGVLFLNQDLTILYHNEALTKQYMYDNRHLLKNGANILEVVSEVDRAQTEFLLKLALEGKIIDREVPVNASNGQTYWFKIKIFPIKNSTNQVIGVTILSLDVSQKRKFELDLQESEIRFKNIIENTPIALAVLDKNFRVIHINSAAEELLGYTCEELAGTDIRNIIFCSYFDDMGSSPLFENSDAFFTNLTSDRFISTINKAGELVTVDITINAYRFNTNKTIVLAARDVRVLLKQEEKLQLHSELFRKIAWQQSHEVRKPLANIKGITELLLDNATSSSIDLYLNYLKEATEELDTIIKNIVNQTYLTQGE